LEEVRIRHTNWWKEGRIVEFNVEHIAGDFLMEQCSGCFWKEQAIVRGYDNHMIIIFLILLFVENREGFDFVDDGLY